MGSFLQIRAGGLLVVLLGLAGAALGQGSIRGTVAEANGGPVIGATVQVKGTPNAAPTDAQGNYELRVAPGSYQVVFSSVGYAAQTLPVTVGAAPVTLNATLRTDAQELSDVVVVVVVGYGSRRVEDITGAVANIRAADANTGGTSTSVDQLIGGRVAGIQFKENTSQPGGGGRTIIRGRNSLFLNTDPLYVIDGFIVNNPPAPTGDASFSAPDRNPLNTINPNDIESVSVLKDASATAIYGAKGSNGVVIITTTKRGTTSTVKVAYDGYGGLQRIAKRYRTLSGPQYMNFWNEQYLNAGKTPLFSEQQAAAPTTDWFREVTRTGSIQGHNLSFSGKSDNLNYYFSLGYYNQHGVIKNTGLERFRGRSNIEYHKDKFRFAINIFAARLNDANQPTQGGVRSSIISSAISFAPYLPVRDNEGVFSRDPLNAFIANPTSLLDIDDKLATDKMNFSVSADYELLPGLKPEVRLTYDVQNADRYFYVPSGTEYNGSLAHGGTGSQTNQRSTGISVSGLLRKSDGTPVYGTAAAPQSVEQYLSRVVTFKFPVQANIPNGEDSNVEMPLLRLAETMLTYAEAQNELGNSAEAVAYIDKLRARAGLAGTAATGQAGVRTAVLNERGWELYHEGYRREDLVRQDQLLNKIAEKYLFYSAFNSPSGTATAWPNAGQAYRILQPIPTSALQLNAQLQQNPGY